METEEIREKKEPKRLPVWACILLFALGLFVTFGLYSTIGFGVLSLILGDEARHPGLLGHMVAEAGMLLAVLTSAVILLYFERRPFSDLGLTLKGHARGLWYGLLAAILLYLIGFGLSLALGGGSNRFSIRSSESACYLCVLPAGGSGRRNHDAWLYTRSSAAYPDE